MTARRLHPSVAFIAWTAVPGRSEEIAHALGGEARCIYFPSLARRQLVPLRYVLSAVMTIQYLLTRRPRSVIVTNPPIFPALIVWAYCRATRTPFLLDSHPTSFGAKDSRLWARFLRVHAWLAARARAVVVTTDEWVETVERWGGHGLVVHEAPTEWPLAAAPERLRPQVLFVGVFASDEPVDEVIDAAALLPDVDVLVTGKLERCPPALRERAPANVTFVGYLGPDDYRAAVLGCDVVLTLTTEPTSVMRAAYEAVYARRPLVISSWPVLRRLFPYAVDVENRAAAIAAGLVDAIARRDELLGVAAAALDAQEARWSDQLAALRVAIRG